MWREKPGFGPKVRTKFGLEGGGGGAVGAAGSNWYKKTAKIGLKFIFIEANKNYLSRQSPHWILLE